ncbi:hypothetical protein ACWF80_38025, partial [Streptomyces iakyrus]
VVPAPHPGVVAPQARTGADNGPAVAPTAAPGTATADNPAPARQDVTASVSATQAAAARVVTARVDIDEHQEQQPAGPVKDWDLPDLPADCAPGRAPELLTDTQVTARIDYGITQEWTQRRVGEFAGRSATVVNRRKKERERVA